MYSNMDYDMEQSGYFPSLREKANMPDADAETLHDVSDYIVWMHKSEKKLAFDMTKDEYARAEISDGRKPYYKCGANEILIAIPTYVLMKTLIEFIDILEGSINWQDVPNFTSYFKPDDHETFPKYIFYSGHDSNMNPLVRVFNEEKYKFHHVPPGASAYIEFSEDDGHAISGLKVNIYYNDNTWFFNKREAIFIEGID